MTHWERYGRKYYEKTKGEQLAKSVARSKEYVLRNRRFIREYLTQHPCVDCGETDPIVLEFDHCRGVKEWNIAKLYNNTTSLARINSELEKCDVVCANCHRRRTAVQFGYYEGL